MKTIRTVFFGLLMIVFALLPILLSGCLPPNPDPRPDPPDPGPQPVIVGDWYIVIEESADRTPGTAEAIRVLQVSEVNFRVYDDDSEDAAGYLDVVRGVRRPALLVLSEDGETIAAQALPQSADEMRRLLGGDQ